MIVMKFGGSSLASAASIGRVASILQSQTDRCPVIVASAMGDTTDHLLEILSHARKAETYSALKLQDQVKNRHFAVSEELLQGQQRDALQQYLSATFRDLHVRMLEVAEGERRFTPELQDWTASLGEQLSSRLLAAVLKERCGEAVHLDARKLILTDSRFTDAEPLYWETYARIRWAVPVGACKGIVVIGGFMGATEDGRTTTLGRGGSDLTASIVGAALNAEEIQVWKDVDGMLTCDPRVLKGGHQVKRLTYEEATELARSGATILHPETMAPARRLRIPIVIRNTFRPEGEGTRIEHRSSTCASIVKSVAVRNRVTLLEVRSPNGANDVDALLQLCSRPGSTASVLCASGNVVYLATDDCSAASQESFTMPGCQEVRIHSSQAILTLVGNLSDQVSGQVKAALQDMDFFPIPGDESGTSLRLAVPQEQLARSLRLLHQAFFANPDPRFFITAETVSEVETNRAKASKADGAKRPRPFVARPALLQFN